MQRRVLAGLIGVVVATGGIGTVATAQVRERPAAVAAARASGATIGAAVRDLTAEEIAQARLRQPGGVRIESVRDGSPAARAGLRSGDLVVEFDGARVRSAREFARLVDETPPGRSVEAVVLRGGSRRTVELTPEPGAGVIAQVLPELRREIERGVRTLPRTLELEFPEAVVVTAPGRMGATLLPVDGQLAEYFGVETGALVSSVRDGSPAAEAGLRAGDVIVRVDGRTVTAPGEVTRAMRAIDEGASATIEVMRERSRVTLTATFPAAPTDVQWHTAPDRRESSGAPT
jgi:serine protease Do